MQNEKKWSPRKALFVIIAASTVLWLGMAAMAQPAAAQNKSVWGTIIGAAGGGFLGSKIGKGRGQLAAVAGGTLLGAIFGQRTGQSLDRADSMYRQQQGGQNYGVRRGYPNRAHWDLRNGRNISHPYPHQQRQVVYQQPRPVQNNGCASGYTREYTTVVTVGGRQVPAWGRACYMPDGSFRPIGGVNY